MLKDRTNILWVPIVLLIFFFCNSADAHEIPISEIKLVPDESQVHLELKLNVFELKFASELDQNNNDKIDRHEFEAKRKVIKQRLLESLNMEIGGALVEAQTFGIKREGNSHHLIFRAHYPVDSQTADLKLTSKLQGITSQSHITWVTYYNTGDKQRAKLDTRSNSVTFDPTKNSPSLVKSLFSPGGLLVVCTGLLIVGIFYRLKKSVFFHTSKSE